MRTRVVVAVLGSVGTAIGGWACSDASQEHPVVVAGAASGAAGGAASGVGTSSGVTARLVALFPSTPVSSGGQSSDAGPGIGPGTESATTPEPPPAPSTTAEASVPAIGSAPDASSAASSASPPPISGGTLLLLADGHTVAASDPDRDQVYVADTAGQMALKSTITLDAGDEPGRLVQDGAGLVHVALRSAGAVVTIDPTTGSIVDRRSVCPAPRGIAWDGATDTVWVACATGELVGLPASGGPPNAQWVVERDLRDVVVGSELLVSEFRSAEILHISMADGTIVSRDTIPPDPGAAPHMAWRTTRFGSNGMTAMLHQRHGLQNIDTMRPNAYLQVNSAPPIVSPQCAVHDANGGLVSTFPLHAALAFDLAASADATKVAVIGAGSTNSSLDAAIVELAAIDGSSDIVLSLTDWQTVSGGQATAVAFDASGNIVVQTREPAALWRFDPSLDVINAQHISLSSISRDDPGHDLFHGPTIANIACASCHGEGGDDGHVWTLNAQPRRTPSLRGTIAGTAPYHWAGDEIDFPTLTEDVFTGRMSGPTLSSTQTNQLAQWVEAIPAPAAPTWVDAASAARGAALFATPTIGCSTCHSGAKFTNNLTLDVGTGQPFQVPPLVGVGWRAPFLHDGCATTLADRFGRCATAGHGAISSLGTQDIGDLVNYLETL